MRISRRQRKGQWQAAGNSGMHHYIRMQLSALALSPSRAGHVAGHGGRHLKSAAYSAVSIAPAQCVARAVPRQAAHEP